MFKEFKEFAMRGNVLDMAVGIIIGAAFGRIITSFVSDIIMPPIGLIIGKVDFSSLFLNISGTLVSDAGGGEGAERGDDQLRNIPEHGDRFPDRGVRDFHAGAPGEPLEQARAGRRADDERMPVLLTRFR